MNAIELVHLIEKAQLHFKCPIHQLDAIKITIVNGTHLRFEYKGEALEFRV